MAGFSRPLHLQAGPIDLLIGVDGEKTEALRALEQARAAFAPVLPELAEELASIRLEVVESDPPRTFRSPVAQRMSNSTHEFREHFITPMAAVAGAVADHMLTAIIDGRRLERAYVNNGGDIALHLAPGRSMRLGIVGDIGDPALDGHVEIDSESGVRGIATSGWRGRSFSLGIADSVTVLATSAAMADAAATLIANAVDINDPAVVRRPAAELDPDSDLGTRPVTVDVRRLSATNIATALAAGTARAESFIRSKRIIAAALRLQGDTRLVTAGSHGFPGHPPRISTDGPGATSRENRSDGE
ncbi:MAG: UPF0280 family protein [Geminicoccaceae bacterium]|nr:UPF0280 family protein [Geminicoccaceae bacterium]